MNIGWTNFGSELVDVLNPFVVVLQAVGRDPDDLGVARGEILGSACNFAEFGGADGCEVTRVRE